MPHAPRRLVAGLILCLLAVPGATRAAGFDCSRARLPVEREICASDGLSRLDDSLSRLYRQALAKAVDQKPLREAQRLWMAKRNACPDAACLETAYRERIAALGGQPGSAPMPAAEPPAARPYAGQGDPVAGKNSDGETLFGATAVIVGHDMFRLFTDKGDFYWGPWMPASRVDAMEATATSLRGKPARITYSQVRGKSDSLECIVETLAP